MRGKGIPTWCVEMVTLMPGAPPVRLRKPCAPVENPGSTSVQRVEKPIGMPTGSLRSKSGNAGARRTTFLIPLTIHNESHSVWS